ncbi:MAG: phospholipase D-like domain-containing protein [bacterium]
MRKFFRGGTFFVIFVINTVLLSKTEVLFSPEDRPAKKLISLIEAAKSKIHAAVYLITDKRIADALTKAKSRGVDVQVVTDKSTIEGTYGKVVQLKSSGIPVFIYNFLAAFSGWEIGRRAFYYQAPAIMHNKFAIIDDKTWTGSFNWTRSADYKNQENVVILDEKRSMRKI